MRNAEKPDIVPACWLHHHWSCPHTCQYLCWVYVSVTVKYLSLVLLQSITATSCSWMRRVTRFRMVLHGSFQSWSYPQLHLSCPLTVKSQLFAPVSSCFLRCSGQLYICLTFVTSTMRFITRSFLMTQRHLFVFQMSFYICFTYQNKVSICTSSVNCFSPSSVLEWTFFQVFIPVFMTGL